MGLSYTIWESILWDGYPIFSAQVLFGVVLLGILGPLLTFITLSWAGRSAASLERAEAARVQQYRDLLALNTIGVAVNQSLNLGTVLDRAIDHILDVLHMESGEVRLIENGRLILRTSRGVSHDFIEKETNIPIGQCVCGACAAHGELIAMEDIQRQPGLVGSTCACERFNAVLAAPVKAGDRVVGMIHVASQQPRTFTPSDRALLISIGNQVGAAIEKAQLHEELKSLNQQLEARVVERTQALSAAKEELGHKADALHQVLAEERRIEERTRARIAHDLHDGTQQIIIGALYETQAAREALDRNPETARARLAAAQELLTRIGFEMRAAIHNLRPLALDAQGLVPALRECIGSVGRHARIRCELHVEGTPQRFSPDGEIAAFRIVQEALNNVEAHAQAQCAHVRVCFRPSDLQIEISDDGVGFDMIHVTEQARTHLGFIGMQERAASAGGELQIASRPGAGTRVTLRLPLETAVLESNTIPALLNMNSEREQ